MDLIFGSIGCSIIELKKAIENDNVILENNNKYGDTTKNIGVLHIYNDGSPMIYEENKNNKNNKK